MHIQITGDGTKLTQAISSYIHTKFEDLEDHYKKIISLKVILQGKEGHEFRVSADAYLAGGHVNAHAQDEILYNAIDSLKDKIIRQVDEHHDRIMQRHHHQTPHADKLSSPHSDKMDDADYDGE